MYIVRRPENAPLRRRQQNAKEFFFLGAEIFGVLAVTRTCFESTVSMSTRGAKFRSNCGNPKGALSAPLLETGIHRTIFAAKLLANPLSDFLHHTSLLVALDNLAQGNGF